MGWIGGATEDAQEEAEVQKSEIRNKIEKSEIQITQTARAGGLDIAFLNLDFVSDFGFCMGLGLLARKASFGYPVLARPTLELSRWLQKLARTITPKRRAS